MFFRAVYCTLPVIDWYAGIFGDTNASGSMNAREKRLTAVVDQCWRGTALQVVTHWRDLDSRDAKNIARAFGGSAGLQIRAPQAWKGGIFMRNAHGVKCRVSTTRGVTLDSKYSKRGNSSLSNELDGKVAATEQMLYTRSWAWYRSGK
jgi:hypothetical protein